MSQNRPVDHERILAALYQDWKRDGIHLGEYASELLGTAFNVFCVVVVVSFMFAPASPIPHVVRSHLLRLFITGFILGGVGWLVALSPPGKLSGAHINPAVSVGFWALGKMHFRDMIGYIVGQMLGALAGVYIALAVLGSLARATRNASLQPSTAAGGVGAFFGEVGATFLLTLVIFTFVSHTRLHTWTPAAATVVVCILVGIDGSYSGAGMNPARWFGPAFSLWYWALAWVYIAGPLIGAAASALLRRSGALTHPVPHTGKIVHDARYRSIFKHDQAPSTPPQHIRRQAAQMTHSQGPTAQQGQPQGTRPSQEK